MNKICTQFLVLLIALLLLSCVPAGKQDLPQVKHLIDTHIHLYDTPRKASETWPPKTDTVLYKPHMPEEYKRVSTAAGVTGVVIVEASPRLEENQWVLDLVEDDPFFIGLVGRIDPARDDFAEQLKTFSKDPRFVGIRGRVTGQQIDYIEPLVLANYRHLQKAGLALDILTNGGGIDGIRKIETIATEVPGLRIVVNHVLGYDIDGKKPSPKWIAAVESLARHKNVYCKVSGLYQRCIQQPAIKDPEHYRALLDILWKAFGQDRLIYGSNWPVTEKSGDYTSFVKLVNAYFKEKGQDACEHYFWMNAAKAYRLDLQD